MPTERQELENELNQLLKTVFPDRPDREEWLGTPDPMLGGRTPRSQIERGRLRDVIGLLATLHSGAFL